MELSQEYKLSVVVKTKYQPAGSKVSITNEHEIALIGYFKSEEALQDWASQNVGELYREAKQ